MHVAPAKAKEIVKSELQSFTIAYGMKSKMQQNQQKCT